MFAAAHSRRSETASDFKTLAGRDAEHRLREQGVEPVEHRFAECRGDIVSDEADRAADTVAVLLRVENLGFHLGACRCVGAADNRCLYCFVCECTRIDFRAVHLADGIHPGDKFRAGHLLQELHRDSTGTNAPDGLACGTPSAATVVAESILQVVTQVGMAGAVPLGNFGVVAAMLVLVEHDERDGRACRLAFEYAAQDLHLVLFVAGRGRLVLAGAPSIQQDLDIVFGEGYACGATVQDGADGRSVGFSPGRYGKYFAKCARHATKYR